MALLRNLYPLTVTTESIPTNGKLMLIYWHKPTRSEHHFNSIVWRLRFGIEVHKLIDGSGHDRRAGRGDYKNVWGVTVFFGFWEWQIFSLYPFVNKELLRQQEQESVRQFHETFTQFSKDREEG